MKSEDRLDWAKEILNIPDIELTPAKANQYIAAATANATIDLAETMREILKELREIRQLEYRTRKLLNREDD